MPIPLIRFLSQKLLGAAPNRERRAAPFRPLGKYAPDPIKTVLVLEHGVNPTTDYYLRPRLDGLGDVDVHYIDSGHTAGGMGQVPEDCFVVIVRYLDRRWAKHLLSHRTNLRGVAYFSDDNLAIARHSELPYRYQRKIHALFERQRPLLEELCSEVWVSTEALAHERYFMPAPAVLPPLPMSLELPAQQRVTCFYHGSASHGAEIEWLVDIIAEVQRRVPHSTFMITGGGMVNRLFGKIPRTLVLHPMAWDTYKNGLPAIRHDIGLAPLLPNEFNRYRSHTKFFDITRFGAVGIYSNTSPYADVIQDGVNGRLLENDAAAWIDAIVALATNPEQRAAMLRNAQQSMAKLAADRPHLPI